MSVLSRIGYDWAVRCFGIAHCNNLALRSQRTLEECAELSQACQLSRADAHLTIDKVYDRPVGEVAQEIGGVLHTVGIMCESMSMLSSREGLVYDMNELHEREVRRVLHKSPEHFAKRNQEKLDLGLDASAQSSGDPLDEKARKAYEHSCDNGPIHSNRLPTWAELGETEKNVWRAACGSHDGPIPDCHQEGKAPTCPTPIPCTMHGCAAVKPGAVVHNPTMEREQRMRERGEPVEADRYIP